MDPLFAKENKEFIYQNSKNLNLDIFRFDHLSIWDEKDNRLGLYCGNMDPPPLVTQSNFAVVRFVSDDIIQKGGFVLHYELNDKKPEMSTETLMPGEQSYGDDYILKNAINDIIEWATRKIYHDVDAILKNSTVMFLE